MKAIETRLWVYLAGKVCGAKWELSRHSSLKDLPFDFAASDGGNHSNHDWGVWPGISALTKGGDDYLRSEVQERAVDQIQKSVVLLAYLDSPDSFGSIAEIASASQMQVPSLVVLRLTDDEELNDQMYDAYWFVCHLSGVVSCTVRSLDEAASEVRRRLLPLYTEVIRQDKEDLTESPIEAKLWRELGPDLWVVTNPQYHIGLYRADFAIPSAQIVIECDGHDYHKTREQRTNDAKRDRYLKADGWEVIRFTGTEIHADPSACAVEVRDLYASRVKREVGT